MFSRIHNQVVQPLLNAMHESQPGGCSEEFWGRINGNMPDIVADIKKILAEAAMRPHDSGFDEGAMDHMRPIMET
jgi:hypothetical protein